MALNPEDFPETEAGQLLAHHLLTATDLAAKEDVEGLMRYLGSVQEGLLATQTPGQLANFYTSALLMLALSCLPFIEEEED